MTFDKIVQRVGIAKLRQTNQPEDLEVENIFKELLENKRIKFSESFDRGSKDITWTYNSTDLHVVDRWIYHDEGDIHKHTRILRLTDMKTGEQIVSKLRR